MCYVCAYLSGSTGAGATGAEFLDNTPEHLGVALNDFSSAIQPAPPQQNRAQGGNTETSSDAQSTGIITSTVTSTESKQGQAASTSGSESVVTIHATDHEAEEGTSTGSLTFTRTNTNGSLSVDFSLSGSAQAGSDYVDVGSSVTFADGQSSVSVLINPISDSASDDNENIVATISTSNNYTIGSHSAAEVKIRDKGYLGSDGIYAPLSETFELSSKPDAKHTVYLDFFGGEYKGGGNWGFDTTFNTIKKYDLDGDSSSFSDFERQQIQRIWAGIAEDFAPFDLNITTKEPDAGDLTYDGAGDETWGVSLLIGEETTGYGFAWSGSDFKLGVESPGYASINTTLWPSGYWPLDIVTSGGSHEIAHTMGLNHDGLTSKGSGSYYDGHQTDLGLWAPIMGTSNPGLLQWSKGEYSGANEFQDDLSVITSDRNGISYVLDDHGDSSSFATNLIRLDDSYSTLFAEGIISETNDVDYFSFNHLGGPVVLNIDPTDANPNLHTGAWLYDDQQTEIAESKSTSTLSSTIVKEELAPGRYFLKVDGIGNSSGSSGGYTDYGSLGQYSVSSGSAVVASFNPDGEQANATISGSSQLATSTISALSSSGFGSSYWSDVWALYWSGGSSIDLDQYISFSVTPGSDYSILAESIEASVYSWVSGTTEFVLRSSVNDFASDIDIQSISGYQTAKTLSFDTSGLSSIDSEIEFRIYSRGGGAGNRYLTGTGWSYGAQGSGLKFKGRLQSNTPTNPDNQSPEGSVSIQGTAQEDEILSLDTSSLSDPNGLGTLSYTWKADNSVISDETSQQLTLGQEHVGKAISAVISYRDDLGSYESVSTTATSAVANVNDDPQGSIDISGLPYAGKTLTASTSSITDDDGINQATLSLQWLRDGISINGATGSSYTLTTDDVGSQISAQLTYTDNFNAGESVTSTATSTIQSQLPDDSILLTYLPDYENADVPISINSQSSGLTSSTLSSNNHGGPGFDNTWALYWNGSSLDLTEYIGFTIEPNAGNSIIPGQIKASFESEVSGSTSFILRSSKDNFSSTLASATANNGSNILAFDLSNHSVISAEEEFRIYATGGGAGYRKLIGADYSTTDSDEGLSFYGVLLSADTTAPTFSSAVTSTDGSKVILTYNEALSSVTASTSDFTITVDGSAATISGVDTSGTTVELTLTNTVKKDQTVTAAYTDPSSSNDSNAIQDPSGNDAASLSTNSVTNTSAVEENGPKNEPPSALILNNTLNSLPENSSTNSRIKLADIAITDDDHGTNLISLAGPDSSSFEIEDSVLFLKAGETLDFETQATYSISLTASDPDLPGTTPVTVTFSLAVEDLAELPQIQSIDDIKTQKKISIFQINTPLAIASKIFNEIIVGTKKKDKITGTSEGEILAGMKGKDVLKGGDSADGFLFNQLKGFGNKHADQIKDFDSNEGDSILLDNSLFGLGKQIKLKSYGSKNKVKKAAKSKNDFVYDEKKGLLYFNENGKQKGWGDGGLFAKLQGAPELGAENFTIV